MCGEREREAGLCIMEVIMKSSTEGTDPRFVQGHELEVRLISE